MIRLKSVESVHLELSSVCNARCPLCPRNFKGYPYNDGYIETNLSLKSCKKIFDHDFLKQLNRIFINGNFGDFVMNSESVDIIDYFLSVNENLIIDVSTNGSARNKKFWESLAGKCNIQFCLDGLEDTHYLYRQETSWKKIIRNAGYFIQSGGHAVWKMIRFNHNLHQIEDCKNLAKNLGFKEFEVIDDGRDKGPVFDKKGNLVHILGDYRGLADFKLLLHKKKTDLVLLEDLQTRLKSKVNCYAKDTGSIYINVLGDVFPCCWTGFNPTTYGHGEYHQVVNTQLAPLIKKNNAIQYSLTECIEWFNAVEQAWNIDSYQNGRLLCCDDTCGSA